MDRLISRYLSRMEDKQEETILTFEDLEQAKQDLLKEISILAQGKKRSLWRTSLINKAVKKDIIPHETDS